MALLPSLFAEAGANGWTMTWPSAFSAPAVLTNNSSAHQLRQTIFMSRLPALMSLATWAAGLDTFWMTMYFAPCDWACDSSPTKLGVLGIG
ncbi:MAG: hypothetical protein BWY91_01340 [bacterium ADurb.BinA028]|nr:MAG: hypothetical protein BWY91_01340 [bacterium ADurb.BinA028]